MLKSASIASSPKKRLFSWCIRFGLGLLAAFIVLLGWSYQLNRQADNPIMVATSPDTSLTQHTLHILAEQELASGLEQIAILFTDRHPSTQLDIQYAHNLDPRLLKPTSSQTTDTNTPDIILAHIANTPNQSIPNTLTESSFVYALSSQSLSNPVSSPTALQGVYLGFVTSPSDGAAMFRAFLLSSPAQDILVDTGASSVDPYHQLGLEFFYNNQPYPVVATPK